LVWIFRLARPVIRAAYKQQLDALWQSGNTQASTRNAIQLSEILKEALDLPNSASSANAGNLGQLGLDSMSAVRLVHFMKDKFNVNIKAEKLTTMSFDQLNSLVTSGKASSAAVADAKGPQEDSHPIDFASEAKLADTFLAGNSTVPLPSGEFQQKRILLTGGTGFIGSFLLDFLLSTTDALIYCLVRSPTKEEGLVKLENALGSRKMKTNDKVFAQRVVPILGDLKRPDLGISPYDLMTLM